MRIPSESPEPADAAEPARPGEPASPHAERPADIQIAPLARPGLPAPLTPAQPDPAALAQPDPAAPAPPGLALLRATLARDRALDWELVLAALAIPRLLEAVSDGPGPSAWRLSVRPADLAGAEAALREFDLENAPPPAQPAPRGYGPTYAGFLFAALLLVFQVRTGPRDAASLWFSLGSADAARIVAGEWWRAFTALTLHADLGHALGNACAGALFWTLLSRRLGPAAASWLVLLAGAGGNLITAQIAQTHYVSVGASTAVFAALGAVALCEATAGAGRRAFLALGAGVGLLGFLGTGKEADLLAHLFGFVCGAFLGALAARLLPQAPKRSPLQPALASLALLALLAAWFRALH